MLPREPICRFQTSGAGPYVVQLVNDRRFTDQTLASDQYWAVIACTQQARELVDFCFSIGRLLQLLRIECVGERPTFSSSAAPSAISLAPSIAKMLPAGST